MAVVAPSPTRYGDSVDAVGEYGFGRQSSGAMDAEVWGEAMDAAQAVGKIVYVRAGEYEATDSLVSSDLTKAPRIVGAGPDATRFYHNAPGKRLFKCAGSFDYLGVTGGSEWENGQPVTAPMARGTTTLTIGSTAGIAAGDFIKIRDESQPMISDWDGTQLGVTGQTFHVRAVQSATQLLIHGAAIFDYTTNARVVRYVPVVNPILRDFSIRPTDPTALTNAASIAIELQHAIGLEASNVHFFDMPNTMVNLLHCIGGSIRHIFSKDGRNDLGTGPYLIKPAVGCQGLLVDDVESWFGRHITTSIGTTHDIPPQLIVVSNCRGFEHSSAPFDVHPSARWWWWVNCMAVMNSRNELVAATQTTPGFQPRGWDMHIVNPTAIGCDVGIGITAGGKRVRVLNGLIERCRVGVYSQTTDDLRISGTEIKDSTEFGVQLTATAKATGTPQLRNIDIDDRVVIDGDPLYAPLSIATWDDNNRVVPRIKNTTKPVQGVRTRQLASAATLTIPRQASYFEVTGATSITRIDASLDQQERTVRLLFVSGLTLDAPNVIVSDTTVAARTEITFSCDGALWVEKARTVKPALAPLNAIGSALAWRAYGLRKLRYNFTGSAIRVRRSSDNAEQDIGFDSLGALDTTALLAFAGAGSAYIKTWYDQSLSGLNLTQATTAKQARIVNAGALETVGGHPAALFDGTDDGYTDGTAGLFAASGDGQTGMSVFTICSGSPAAIKAIVSESHVGADTAVYAPLQSSSVNKLTSTVVNDAVSVLLASSGIDGTFFDDTLRVASVTDEAIYTDSVDPDNPDPVYDHNSQVFRNNGASETARTYTRSGTFANINGFGLGCRPTPGVYFPGHISEAIMFKLKVSSADRTALETNQLAWVA